MTGLFMLAAGAQITPQSRDGSVTVRITATGFVPSVVVIVPGTPVVWTNETAISQSITANDGSFASGPIPAGMSFSFVFNQPLQTEYYSQTDPPARGAVQVGAVPVGGLGTPTTVTAAQTPTGQPELAATGAAAVATSVTGLLLVGAGGGLLLLDVTGRSIRPDLALVRPRFRRRADDLIPGAGVGRRDR